MSQVESTHKSYILWPSRHNIYPWDLAACLTESSAARLVKGPVTSSGLSVSPVSTHHSVESKFVKISQNKSNWVELSELSMTHSSDSGFFWPWQSQFELCPALQSPPITLWSCGEGGEMLAAGLPSSNWALGVSHRVGGATQFFSIEWSVFMQSNAVQWWFHPMLKYCRDFLDIWSPLKSSMQVEKNRR